MILVSFVDVFMRVFLSKDKIVEKLQLGFIDWQEVMNFMEQFVDKNSFKQYRSF